MHFNLSPEQLAQINRELYTKAYTYLTERFGSFDPYKVRLAGNVVSACRIVEQQKKECDYCTMRGDCKRGARLEIEPIVNEALLEITGFRTGGVPCKLMQEEENRHTSWAK